MESAHSEKIVEISENAEKCLINEYLVSASENAVCTVRYSFLPANTHRNTSLHELKWNISHFYFNELFMHVLYY